MLSAPLTSSAMLGKSTRMSVAGLTEERVVLCHESGRERATDAGVQTCIPHASAGAIHHVADTSPSGGVLIIVQ